MASASDVSPTRSARALRGLAHLTGDAGGHRAADDADARPDLHGPDGQPPYAAVVERPAARNRRLEQGDRSREEILDCASRLMATRGYDGTTISALCKESGLPASSIYYHFASKEGVLRAVMERGATRFALQTALDDLPVDASRVDKVVWVLRRAVHFVDESPEFLRLQTILLLSASSGDAHATVLQLRQRQRDGFRDALAICLAKPGEPSAEEVADHLVDFASATFEGAFLAAQSGSSSYNDTLAILAEVLIRLADSYDADATSTVANDER